MLWMAWLHTRGLQVSSLWPVCPTARMQTFAAEAVAMETRAVAEIHDKVGGRQLGL